MITNLFASVELVIFPSALPAKTSWKSLAGASTEFNFDFGKNSFAFSSCDVPRVVAIVTLELFSESQVENLLKFFYSIHDPTTLNKQGPDIGPQYRSEIFYTKKGQKEIAEEAIREVSEKFNGKIVTKVSKEHNYCKAEDYHQKYFKKKGSFWTS